MRCMPGGVACGVGGAHGEAGGVGGCTRGARSGGPPIPAGNSRTRLMRRGHHQEWKPPRRGRRRTRDPAPLPCHMHAPSSSRHTSAHTLAQMMDPTPPPRHANSPTWPPPCHPSTRPAPPCTQPAAQARALRTHLAAVVVLCLFLRQQRHQRGRARLGGRHPAHRHGAGLLRGQTGEGRRRAGQSEVGRGAGR